jgi:hypothetical protein
MTGELKMDDEIDGYLSYRLKCWAAGQQLPAKGRERLIGLASTLLLPRDKPAAPASKRFSDMERSHRFPYRSPTEFLLGPFSLSGICTSHIIAPLQLTSTFQLGI